MTEEPGRKPYKVSVVDRETGGARPSRGAAGADTPSEPEPADADETGDDAEEGSGPDSPDPQGTSTKPAQRAPGKGGKGGKPPAAKGRWSTRSLGRKSQIGLLVVAVLGVVGTAVFGNAWASLSDQQNQQAQVRTVTNNFLLALTNFDAKSVDADFNKIQQYATGSFATQSNQFFGSTIRSQLEAALASSRGQIRSQFVQSINGNKASVYSVVDQTYINNKMTSPSADELQIQTDLTQTGSGWKVSNVTVLNNSGAGSGTGSTSPSSTTTTVPSATTAPSTTAAP
ncbi:MAG TPA: hypothetical protein VG412_01990 [Acidimicrobiales bacterium]|jgi:hypothetical protein|nr:hypothetical protein [Acidimicrobiales bacterium]